MNEEQISILNWMYNYCVIHMKETTDIGIMTRKITERFPDEAKAITALKYTIE